MRSVSGGDFPDVARIRSLIGERSAREIVGVIPHVECCDRRFIGSDCDPILRTGRHRNAGLVNHGYQSATGAERRKIGD